MTRNIVSWKKRVLERNKRKLESENENVNKIIKKIDHANTEIHLTIAVLSGLNMFFYLIVHQ
jgi:uncharacterized membrane protein